MVKNLSRREALRVMTLSAAAFLISCVDRAKNILPAPSQALSQTQAGDIILYQGNALVIYYAPNSWNFTRLGRTNDISAQELREILGDGNVTVTLSLS